MNKVDFESLKRQSLLNGLSESELISISEILNKNIVPANSIIFEEGEHSTDLYLILDGEIGIYKRDVKKQCELPLNMLLPGNFFGEMAFIDPSPRSAMAKTIKETTILKLSKADLDKPSMRIIYNKLIENIAKVNIDRLRAENSSQITSLRYSLQELQTRCDWATLVMALLGLFSLANMLFFLFASRFTLPFSSIYWAILAVSLFTMIKRQQLDLELFGITSSDLGKVTKETIWICLGGLLLLALLITQRAYFPKVAVMSSGMVLNAFFLCIFREFVSRGVLLTSVLNFFDKQKIHIVVFVTALFLTFSVIVNYTQLNMLVTLLVMNIFLNYVYLRHKNLLSVICISFLFELLF